MSNLIKKDRKRDPIYSLKSLKSLNSGVEKWQR